MKLSSNYFILNSYQNRKVISVEFERFFRRFERDRVALGVDKKSVIE